MSCCFVSVAKVIRHPGYQRGWAADGTASQGHDLARSLHVIGDRGDELLDGVVSNLVAQTAPELDRQRVPVQVASREVEEERLDVERVDAERRVRSHVDRGHVALPAHL